MEPKRVAAGLVTVVLVLVMALAYNMGGSAQEARDAPQIELTNGRIAATQLRLRRCKAHVRDLTSDRSRADHVLRQLNETVEKAQGEVSALERDVAETEVRITACEKLKEQELQAWQSNPDSSAESRLATLTAEIAAANQTLDGIVMNRTADSQDMLRLLLALRRSNSAMEAKLQKSQSK